MAPLSKSTSFCFSQLTELWLYSMNIKKIPDKKKLTAFIINKMSAPMYLQRKPDNAKEINIK